MIGMRDKFIDYDIIKRYIDSKESSVTITFTDYDKTIIIEKWKIMMKNIKLKYLLKHIKKNMKF